MDTNIIWMNVEDVASKSNCKKRHVGCIIVDEAGELVSAGYNVHRDGICDCNTTSTALHAEQMAVDNIPAHLRETDLYAYINHPPCEKCTALLAKVCEEIEVNPTSVRLDGSVDATLEVRGHTHGDFKDSSKFVQTAKDNMRVSPNWFGMTQDKQEALDMIQHKVGRILYGDHELADTWHDIAGYATLAEKECIND